MRRFVSAAAALLAAWSLGAGCAKAPPVVARPAATSASTSLSGGTIWNALRRLVWGDEAAGDRAAADERIGQEIGESNYEAVMDLIDCKLDEADAALTAGNASGDPNHRLATLWIASALAEERRDRELSQQLCEKLREADPDVHDADDARLDTRLLVKSIRDQRRRVTGLAICPSGG